MCRHLMWLGPERTLASLLFEPEWSLQRQAYEPRRQDHGIMNADGFGIAWYQKGIRADPARYRRSIPIWTDGSLPSFAPLVRSRAILAALRSTTIGQPVQETDTAPFVRGRWAFSLNGAASLDVLVPMVDSAKMTVNPCDATVLASIVFDRLTGGESPQGVLTDVAVTIAAKDPAARLNMLLTDGDRAVATAYGASLAYLRRGRLAAGGVLLASEPLDDDSGWVDVPDRSIVTADSDEVSVQKWGI